MKPMKLYINQYGDKFYARTVKELRSQIKGGGSRVYLMYCSIADVEYHSGYVIGGYWLSAYTPCLKKA